LVKHAVALSMVGIFGGGACSGMSSGPSTEQVSSIDRSALYVVNGGDASISVLDASSLASLGTIRLNGARYPHHLGLSPDRSRLVVAIPGIDLSAGHGGGDHAGHGGSMAAESFLLILDARTGETRNVRRMDAPSHNGAFSSDGQEIWTAQMSTPGEGLVLDAESLETRHRIPVGDSPAEVSFSPDGGSAFVANGGSDSVTVIDVATKSVLKTLGVGDGPVGAWPGADGVMYVDNEQGRSISAIDASKLEVVRNYALGFTPAMAAVAPGGRAPGHRCG
jgi:YVTN family beta-propeller protein